MTNTRGNEKGGPFGGPPCRKLALESLQRLYVLRLPALGALDDVELNGLTFLEAAESASLDGRIMNEYVFSVLTADKAVALRVIEPLNCSLFHCVACSFGIDVAAIRTDCFAAGMRGAGTAAADNVDQSSNFIITAVM